MDAPTFIDLGMKMLPTMTQTIFPEIKKKIAEIDEDNKNIMILMQIIMQTLMDGLKEFEPELEAAGTNSAEFFRWGQANKEELNQYIVEHPELKEKMNEFTEKMNEITSVVKGS